MSASKYLPPFTAEERVTVAGDRSARTPVDPGALSESEVAAISRSNEFPTAPNIIDDPVRLAVLPEHWTGWLGRPGLTGSRSGRDWSPKFTTTALRVGGEDRSDSTGLVATDGPTERISSLGTE